ncbi:hypothetical protein BH23CHL7_BH23CHL7_20260 [soil metagenome]
MKQRGKAQRRGLRKREKGDRRRDGRELAFYESDWPVGPDVVSATPAELVKAIEALPRELTWDVVAPRMIPLFERVRPYPPGMPPPIGMLVPPGVRIGFGLDIGPAFVTVSDALASEWAKSPADMAAQAMANLHHLASEVAQAEVFHGPVGDVETAWLQTKRGIGSVLVLAPTELRRIFGGQPRQFVAPMRDLLIGFSAEGDPEFAAWLFADIASQDPNCLHPRLFTFDGRQVGLRRLHIPGLTA